MIAKDGTNPDSGGEIRARFVRLVAATESDLLRTARRLCRGNEDQAQDLIQETLIRTYAACCHGQWNLMQATFLQARSYLLHTATNQYINLFWRRRKWDAGVSVDDLTFGGETGPPVTHARPDDTPGVALQSATLAEEIEQALARLPEDQRLAVYLVDIQERTYEEAAYTLETPIGTIRSRLARARATLREHLRTYAQERKLIPDASRN